MAETEVKKINGRTVCDTTARQEIENLKKSQSGNQGEPAEDDIPKVFITGVKPTTKDDVLAEMEYVSKTDRFHAYLEIKCQGTSSMAYAKKNFTVKMYSDEAREAKLKKSFKDWNHNGNKYVLKANWIDHSHARNIVSARLWDEVVASRPDYDSLPVQMRNSPRNGAVDGFPVKVYYNGTYEGIYTWNIGKEDWMWNMDEDNPNHVLMCAESNVSTANPCNFNALWSGTHEDNWSVEVGTNSTALKTSLNNLIQFVMDNDGEAFKTGIGAYLDIQSAIDYYIHQYVICGLDGLAKNMLLATYDGTKWICGAYDMDSTFGLWWTGGSFVSAEYKCPEEYQANASLLWQRIEANYVDELKTRYAELRSTVYSYSNMVTYFERFMDTIGLDLYAEDLTIYTAIPSGDTNNIKQIRDFIRDRLVYVDAEIEALRTPVPATSITLSHSEITFTDTTPVTITATITPEDTTDPVLWQSSDSGIAAVANGVVTPVAEGDCTITATCGNYSATCSVTVEGEAADPTLLYALPDTPVSLVYSPNNIDTGVVVMDVDKDITWVIDMANTRMAAPYKAFLINGEFCIRTMTGGICLIFGGEEGRAGDYVEGARTRFIVTHALDSGKAIFRCKVGDNDVVTTEVVAINTKFIDAATNMTIEQPHVQGTVNDFRVYNTVWSDEEITNYFS